MVISPKTVGAHVEHIYMKLGVQTRAQAVAVAYRDELLDGDVAAVPLHSGAPAH
jgi:DNA-binding NarL/FixJ family response regulator